ncbi:unnamed protein product [Amoebophrya sp. A25]|nr:unnamed protein product [Amoebophrya sp. A25]|eukprot:GSA25T00001186001.1
MEEQEKRGREESASKDNHSIGSRGEKVNGLAVITVTAQQTASGLTPQGSPCNKRKLPIQKRKRKPKKALHGFFSDSESDAHDEASNDGHEQPEARRQQENGASSLPSNAWPSHNANPFATTNNRASSMPVLGNVAAEDGGCADSCTGLNMLGEGMQQLRDNPSVAKAFRDMMDFVAESYIISAFDEGSENRATSEDGGCATTTASSASPLGDLRHKDLEAFAKMRRERGPQESAAERTAGREILVDLRNGLHFFDPRLFKHGNAFNVDPPSVFLPKTTKKKAKKQGAPKPKLYPSTTNFNRLRDICNNVLAKTILQVSSVEASSERRAIVKNVIESKGGMASTDANQMSAKASRASPNSSPTLSAMSSTSAPSSATAFTLCGGSKRMVYEPFDRRKKHEKSDDSHVDHILTLHTFCDIFLRSARGRQVCIDMCQHFTDWGIGTPDTLNTKSQIIATASVKPFLDLNFIRDIRACALSL